jgi:1-pyrroline-5-carboxylate dehydrogenase
MNAVVRVPAPTNEPVLSHAPGSPEKKTLKAELARMSAEVVEIPLVIGGREVRTGRMADVRMPHRHAHVLGRVHLGGAAEVSAAMDAARAARPAWAAIPWTERAAVFLRAADLLAGRWRAVLNAATMLGQSKTPHQAEIDAACELIDFWRFNAAYAEELYGEQPLSPPGVWNRVEYRPIEGTVFAVSPFNFTSIAGNLPTAPALMGCTVVWKPASSAVLSAHYILALLREAGLPDGVINLVIGSGGDVGGPVLDHTDLGGLHFTGSTAVFQAMWKTIATNLTKYGRYPRIVGETGGKDFIFAHASADTDALAIAIARGAFEYQGQKCSAASRVYVPDSIWPRVQERLLAEVARIRMGDVSDFRNFMGAVIDKASFQNISGYVEHAKASSDLTILAGGECDDRVGWFVRPTVVLSRDPRSRLMCEEIFGPVVTIHVYPEARYEETLRLCDETSPYALTGAIFANDRAAIQTAHRALVDAAGNFYVNDKPTGAVVGQQPFGGARASGTNDKAGSLWNLIRWVSPRTVKETFSPPRSLDYPFMGEE